MSEKILKFPSERVKVRPIDTSFRISGNKSEVEKRLDILRRRLRKRQAGTGYIPQEE